MSTLPIIVVDDDRDTCESLSDIIEDLGYKVEKAHDGPAALRAFELQRFGLALVDYKMPGVNGVDLYRRMKELRSEIVGVLVTAFAGKETLSDASAAGVRQVLAKPIDFEKLLPLIEEIVGKPAPQFN